MDQAQLSDYSRRVGERLRAVRKQKRLSLQAVELASKQEFKASVLGAYERGERAISVPRLQRLAMFYQVPVDQLLPKEAPPTTGGGGGTDETIDLRTLPPLGNGAPEKRPQAAAAGNGVTIDLARLQQASGPERELLRRYLGMIQVRRGDFNGRMLTIREEDLRALACLFDTSPEHLRRRFDNLGLCLR